MKKIIIFGGTTLARDVLQKTMAQQADVFCFYSLKNIAGQKFLPTIADATRGKIISGGFAQYDAGHDSVNDSARGLARFCRQEKIAALVVAVSPFARVMMATATRVARELSLPIFYLQPAPWQIDNEIKNKKILLAKDINHLAQLFLQHQPPTKNIFVALGGKDGAAFLSQAVENKSEQAVKKPSTLSPIIFWRAIYPPRVDAVWQEKISLKIILSPPQDVAREKIFLQENNIGLLVAKNSGGDHSNNKNKITAALACDVPILLLSPPPSDDVSLQGTKGATNDKNHFTKVDDLLAAFNRIIK